MGQGFEVAGHRVPIVPAAILFDLANGGNKDWGRYPPYRELGYEACRAASADFSLGSQGAGTGALTAGLKGGLGSASTVLSNGIIVGALAAVNAAGSVTVAATPCFWAAPFEIDAEFGGLGLPSPIPPEARRIPSKAMGGLSGNTTIAVIATNTTLGKAGAKRLAIAAHDGFARAIWPSHTPVDGDLVFAVSTGARPLADPVLDAIALGHAAASCLSRAIGRAIFLATPAPGDLLETWRQKWGRG
jgi:L-aminopeptidase/D-esterase-like protein